MDFRFQKSSLKTNQMSPKKFVIIVLLFSKGLWTLYAQQSVPASGGNATGNGGSASYSVGQVVYTAITSPGGSVLQGVQQPFEITVITGVAEAKGITLQCFAFPNPTSDNVTLKIEGELKPNYVAYLYDIHGKLLKTQKLEGNETSISMQNFAKAIYFLKITDDTKEIKSFKIIKN